MDEENDREELYEFFFVKNVNPVDVEEVRASNAEISFQTVSFYDRPNENDWKINIRNNHRHTSEVLTTNRYNSDYAVNQAIPIDDSVEIDVDELKYDEAPVAENLALHIGREGRNGPCVKSEGFRFSSPNHRTDFALFQDGELDEILQSPLDDYSKKGDEENKQSTDLVLIKNQSSPKNSQK